jgi:DNA-binding transcriptional regulator YbjK
MTTTRDLTDNQILRLDALRQVDRVASALEASAERLRREASQLNKEDRDAAAVIADVVNEYIQGTNSIGPMFWSMIRDLSRMK